MATDIKDIYITALRNTRALEKQGLEQMERQLDRLEHYPDYAAVLRAHVPVTRTQIDRLDAALKAVGESASTLKETVTSVAGTIGATAHALAGDETLKNLYAGYAYQYDQIAAYRSLSVIAEAAGASEQGSGFKSAIEEERTAADAIDGVIESVTKTYLGRETGGAKAAH